MLRPGSPREQRNPAGQLPCLELDDGTFLAEILPICEYLEEKQPRLRRKRACKFEPLAIEQREPACRPVRLVGKAALLEQFDATRIGVALATTAVPVASVIRSRASPWRMRSSPVRCMSM